MAPLSFESLRSFWWSIACISVQAVSRHAACQLCAVVPPHAWCWPHRLSSSNATPLASDTPRAGQLKAAGSLLVMPSQRGALAALQRTLAGPRLPLLLLASGAEAWRAACPGLLASLKPGRLLAAPAWRDSGLAGIPRSEL